ncbi:MAG: gliding motility-associated C-terminal domain-containing protein, partial [Chitinophagales bacterium]|nr:gliding motility-associated C-terminal domain-containing protein [Chitinophagales bacterium]
YTYQWSHSSGLKGNKATGLNKGSYRVTVSDGVCLPFDTLIQITGPDSLISVSVQSVSDNCSQSSGSAKAFAQGGTPPYRYLWSNGATTHEIFNLKGKSNVSVTVTDNLGCITETKAFIDDVGAPQVAFLTVDTLCPDSSNGVLQIQAKGGQPPYKYQWSHDSLLKASFAVNLPPGYYAATVTDQAGCSSVLDILLPVYQNPFLEVGNDTTILKGTVAKITVQTNMIPESVQWKPFIQSADNNLVAYAKPETTTTYRVSLIYGKKGCRLLDSITVNVMEEETILEVPNIFTPNNDGLNDFFYIKTKAVSYFNIKIFDRWGNKVFESFDTNFRWDGQNEFTAENSPNGVYVYALEYSSINNPKREIKKGNITLVR